MLYHEGVNKSAAASLFVSLPSVRRFWALAFCCVIYARLFPKMSFLSLPASSPLVNVSGITVSSLASRMLSCIFCHSSHCSRISLALFYSQNMTLNFSPFLFLSDSNTLVPVVPTVCIISWLFCSHRFTRKSVKETCPPQ